MMKKTIRQELESRLVHHLNNVKMRVVNDRTEKELIDTMVPGILNTVFEVMKVDQVMQDLTYEEFTNALLTLDEEQVDNDWRRGNRSP